MATESITKKNNEDILQYYRRIKESVSQGLVDLEKSEIYSLMFGEIVSADHARKAMRTLDLLLEVNDNVFVESNEQIPQDNIPQKATVEINKDGSQSSSKLILMSLEDSKDSDFLLKAHGYDVNTWELVSARSNIWNAYSKQDGIMELYSSKINVKPRTSEMWTIDDWDNYFENKEFRSVLDIKEPTNYDPSGEILEITLPDLHAGLFSWRKETGEDYDIYIAKKNFLKCFSDIIERCQNRKFEKIVFVTLGDLLHVDGDNQLTSRGTFQQLDGRISKVYDVVLDMLIDAVELLAEFCPVEIIYISGNHDRLLGYSLMKGVEKAFRKVNGVTFDNLPNPRKWRRFENVLIGWSHGDCPKNNISEWLQSEARKDFGKSLYSEVHTGHLHHQQTLEKSGMIVRYLPTICSSSAWEHQQAFGKNVKTIVSFVWNKYCGLREMWFSNL